MPGRRTAPSALEKPLVVAVGQPLRVAVYGRLAEAIRAGDFTLGEMLPRETELAAQLGVSRTPVREALMLLEEDGLLVTRRGVGRFVTEALPRTGLEQLQPFETVLAEPGVDLAIRVLRFELEAVTDYLSNRLSLESTANTWVRDLVFSRDGEPVATVQEHIPAGRYLSDLAPRFATDLPELATEEAGLLSVMRRYGLALHNGVCQIVPAAAGPTRAKLLKVRSSDPVLVLTQTVEVDDVPIYTAKCVVTARHGAMTVMQSTPNAP